MTLNELKERNKGLKPIIFKEFDSMENLKKYKLENKTIFDEYFDNLEEIEKLEWELLTPEEQAEKKEFEKQFKLKREGKLYDYLIEKKKNQNK